MQRLTTSIVGPDGPLSAKLCFIGQAPGEREDEKGIPFYPGAPAGGLLMRCFKEVGLLRSEVLLYNVFVQRPPKNDVGYFFQDKSNTKLTWEGEEHVASLKRWLENLLEVRNNGGGGPNILVALGREAMMILTGKKRIWKWRGSLLPCTLVPGFKVYPTLHPSGVMRIMNEKEEALFGERKAQQQNALPLLINDLKRAIIQSEDPNLVLPQREFYVPKTASEAVELIMNLKSQRLIAWDIETLGGGVHPVVWCIGFSASPETAVTIPIIRGGKLHWTVREEALIWRAISEVFLDEKSKKIFQNGSYDLSILGRYYGLRLADGTYGDTMLLHHASYPYLRKGLDVLASIYTWEPYYKDDGKVWSGRRISDEAEYTYNSRDCAVTREIYPVVERDAKELGTYSGYERTTSVFPSILHMQIRGVKIDLEKKEQLNEDFTNRAKLAQLQLNALAEGTYNIGSSSQMAMLLYHQLDLPVQYNYKTKKPTTDKDAVNRLLKKFPRAGERRHDILTALSDFRKFDKLKSTYAQMEVDPDGRIHTSYGWISTYRLSSSESHFGGGGNLQNIPVRSDEGRAIRSLFVADDGLILLASDLAQAEAREVAWLAGDLRLIELFQTPGYDVHWLRAKDTFLIPKEVPYNPKALFRSRFLEEEFPLSFYRRIGKTIVHAFNYKMGPRMLQNILIREGVYIPELTCKFLIEQTKRNNPLTVRWQNKITEEIRATRTLTTPLGRKRNFRGRLNDNLFRSAVAFIPQSTVGELLQLAIQDIYDNCPIFEPLLNVHDEVVGQCRPEDVERSKIFIRSAMEIPHEVGGRELIIPCEFKIGSSWGEMKEIE